MATAWSKSTGLGVYLTCFPDACWVSSDMSLDASCPCEELATELWRAAKRHWLLHIRTSVCNGPNPLERFRVLPHQKPRRLHLTDSHLKTYLLQAHFFAPIKFLSSYHIVTWSICEWCSIRWSFISHCLFFNLINFYWVTVENQWFWPDFQCYFTVTEQIMIELQIGDWVWSFWGLEFEGLQKLGFRAGRYKANRTRNLTGITRGNRDLYQIYCIVLQIRKQVKSKPILHKISVVKYIFPNWYDSNLLHW
jgi:hypothetical protein